MKGYFNLDDMLGTVQQRGGAIGVCGTSMDARGINADRLAEGVRPSRMKELTEWSKWADKVLIF